MIHFEYKKICQACMKTVGVFKTDIDDHTKAESILAEIRRHLPESDPSLDFEDCDKVLRVESQTTSVNEGKIENILNSYGYTMEVLP